MKRPVRTKVAAVLFGLILFFFLAEIGSRLVFSRVMNFNVEMWKYARMVKTSKITENLRFEHRPGVEADLMGVHLTINKDGMRGPEVENSPQDGVIRIAALGDSITLGWGVNGEETFVRRLENSLSNRMENSGADKIEILNFGVGNYNIDDDYRILREKVIGFKPRAVMLALFINDAEPSTPIRKSFFLENSCFAVWLWGQWDSLCRKIGIKVNYEDYYDGLYSSEMGGLDRMRNGLSNIVDLSKREEITPVVLILPELHQLTDYPFVSIHSEIAAMVSSYGVLVLDLFPAVEGMEPEALWVNGDDPHPNGKAHGIYANAILDGIDWEKVLEEKVLQ